MKVCLTSHNPRRTQETWARGSCSPHASCSSQRPHSRTWESKGAGQDVQSVTPPTPVPQPTPKVTPLIDLLVGSADWYLLIKFHVASCKKNQPNSERWVSPPGSPSSSRQRKFVAVDTDLGQPLYRTDNPVATWRERTLSSTASVLGAHLEGPRRWGKCGECMSFGSTRQSGHWTEE